MKEDDGSVTGFGLKYKPQNNVECAATHVRDALKWLEHEYNSKNPSVQSAELLVAARKLLSAIDLYLNKGS